MRSPTSALVDINHLPTPADGATAANVNASGTSTSSASGAGAAGSSASAPQSLLDSDRLVASYCEQRDTMCSTHVQMLFFEGFNGILSFPVCGFGTHERDSHIPFAMAHVAQDLLVALNAYCGLVVHCIVADNYSSNTVRTGRMPHF
jgi:hypothetical protein